MPKFSVVISVYNKEGYISKTLQSVLAQTCQDFEIIIRDDGSTDNSKAEILKFDDPRIYFEAGKNVGAAEGRNKVIKKATGAYIALLDADDVWESNYLQEQYISIKQFPEQSLFATAISLKKGPQRIKREYSLQPFPTRRVVVDFFKASMLSSILHSSTTVVKKEVFQEIGYYNPNIKSGQDTDIYIRMGLKYKVVFNPAYLVTYNIIKNSLFRTSNSISDKTTFEEYESLEKEHEYLKKFIDNNRFSLAVLSKLEGNKKAFRFYSTKIASSNLNYKQKFILKLPAFVIQGLKNVKLLLERLGLQTSVFRS